jgi:uncharacterized protein YkwD
MNEEESEKFLTAGRMFTMSRYSQLFLIGAICLPTLPGRAAATDTKSKEKATVELSKDEQAILDLTNAAREKAKLPPLKPNAVLSEVARKHSANMAKQETMAHELDKKTPADRLKAAGYSYSRMAENVAMTLGDSNEGVFKSWMESEHHRDNILGNKFTEIGIGLATSDSGKVYYTQVFGTPRGKR